MGRGGPMDQSVGALARRWITASAKDAAGPGLLGPGSPDGFTLQTNLSTLGRACPESLSVLPPVRMKHVPVAPTAFSL